VKTLELPRWKLTLNWIAALLIGALFLASGIWKITDPQAAAGRMIQVRIPASLSLAAALAVGISETLAGVLTVAPRLRRWGAALAALLLVVFMIFVAVQYSALRGADCSCFPWVKRMVGPAFFIGDAVMLLLAVVAAAWSRRPAGFRAVAVVLGTVVVFALVSYGVADVGKAGAHSPDQIAVDGRPYPIDSGKVFLFFFNPSCTHCLSAAREMSGMQWGDTRLIAVPVEHPEWASQFLESAGLAARISTDFEKLKQAFNYKTYPFAVALENGREKASLTKFDAGEPVSTIKRLGFAQ
jgi:uncharacterized membrane protein YphA (DoxX/SURF4 family)